MKASLRIDDEMIDAPSSWAASRWPLMISVILARGRQAELSRISPIRFLEEASSGSHEWQRRRGFSTQVGCYLQIPIPHATFKGAAGVVEVGLLRRLK